MKSNCWSRISPIVTATWKYKWMCFRFIKQNNKQNCYNIGIDLTYLLSEWTVFLGDSKETADLGKTSGCLEELSSTANILLCKRNILRYHAEYIHFYLHFTSRWSMLWAFLSFFPSLCWDRTSWEVDLTACRESFFLFEEAPLRAITNESIFHQNAKWTV